MRARLAILAAAVALAFAALLAHHWMILRAAPRNPRFVRFARRYAARGGAEDAAAPRANVLDCKGRALDIAPAGSALRRALDDLAVESGRSEVALCVDAALQRCAEELLAGKSGAIVAIEPCTGKIRALASAPPSAGLNRALDGLYPPGSAFKIFVAGAALTAGLSPVLECAAGGYRAAPGTPPIRDWQERAAAREGRAWRGLGKIGMGEALAKSSNTYFAQLGVMLGAERFAAAAERARLRGSVAILETGAASVKASGATVPEDLKTAQLAAAAIGQGELQFTPLGMAMIAAAAANDGLMLEPRLLAASRPALRARPFSMDAAKLLKAYMRAAVRGGTGKACDLAGLEVCGKTGTAQTGEGRADHAWFVCFAPAKTPRLAVAVVVEHGGGGGAVAAPLARKFLETASREGCLP